MWHAQGEPLPMQEHNRAQHGSRSRRTEPFTCLVNRRQVEGTVLVELFFRRTNEVEIYTASPISNSSVDFSLGLPIRAPTKSCRPRKKRVRSVIEKRVRRRIDRNEITEFYRLEYLK